MNKIINANINTYPILRLRLIHLLIHLLILTIIIIITNIVIVILVILINIINYLNLITLLVNIILILIISLIYIFILIKYFILNIAMISVIYHISSLFNKIITCFTGAYLKLILFYLIYLLSIDGLYITIANIFLSYRYFLLIITIVIDIF